MLNREMVVDRLNHLFRDIFDDDDIAVTDDTTAADIDGWDSLTHIRLILGVEREFRIKMTAAEVGSLKNVGQMIGVIVARAG
jgi:acyl carrier protein